MPVFNKPCDIYQGYNFRKDKQGLVGFITKLTVGTDSIAADQTCKDPTNPETDVKAVAVLSNFLWHTGVTDALYFSGQISTANRQTVSAALLKSMTNVEVLIQYSVYEYDPLQKKYFLASDCGGNDLKGLLEKNGDELNMAVADDPSPEVQSPKNFAFHLGVKPQTSAQTVNLAVSSDVRIVKAWGLAVGG